VVVGYLNTDVPEALILRSGAFPLRVLGDVNGKTPHADEYIKPGFNPVARALFTFAGKFDLDDCCPKPCKRFRADSARFKLRQVNI
jgi:hypothetical protein